MTEKLFTIDELMEGKAPGSVKIICPGWGPDEYFVPFYRDKTHDWCGLDDAGDSLGFDATHSRWKLYTEPKKKKVLRPAVYKQGADFLLSPMLYESLEKAKEHLEAVGYFKVQSMAPDSYAVEVEE